MLEYQSIFTRLIKYLLEGVAVAIAATLLSRKQQLLSYKEIALIALTAALTFFLLDTLAPSIGSSSRTGAGFGLGSNMVGFPMVGGSHTIDHGVQTGGNAATEATGVDATSDAKALPSDYNYGPEEPPKIVPQPEGPPTMESAKICEITPGVCQNQSPLFTQPINSCDCALNCAPTCPPFSCPEPTCPPPGQIVFPDCNIASNNSPYKIVPGMFSHQIVLPGYNECVKAYNYFETPLKN